MDESTKNKLAELKKTRTAEPRKKEPEAKKTISFISGTKKSELMLDSKQRMKLEKFIDKLDEPPKPRVKKVVAPS